MSSRSLIRALDGYFGGSVESSDFFPLAESFLASHGTMALILSMTFDVNDNLNRCYQEHVAGNDELEIKFIEVLGVLCPVFSLDATCQWVNLYIKPAFDTGVSLQFVHRAKEFLTKLAVVRDTDDSKLFELRKQVSTMVISGVVKRYLDEEHLLIKDKCIEWIKGAGENVSMVLASEYQNVCSRYHLVCLISLLKSEVVVCEPLWSMLLTSLEVDMSELVVNGLMQIVIRGIPYLKSDACWPRIMAAVVKMGNWANATPKPGSWTALPPDTYNGTINAHLVEYLTTLLYGMVPFQVMEVARGDVDNIRHELAYAMLSTPSLDQLRNIFKHLYVHPLMVLELSAVPFSWVDGDISVACVSLNPEIGHLNGIGTLPLSRAISQTLIGGLCMDMSRKSRIMEDNLDESDLQMFTDHQHIFISGNSGGTISTIDTELPHTKSDYQLQELLLAKNQLAFVFYLRSLADQRLEEADRYRTLAAMKPTPVVSVEPVPLSEPLNKVISELKQTHEKYEECATKLAEAQTRLDSSERALSRMLTVVVPAKTAEINHMANRIEELEAALANTYITEKTKTLVPDPLRDLSSEWIEEAYNYKGEIVRLNHERAELVAANLALKENIGQLELTITHRVDEAKLDLRETIDGYVKHFERRIDHLTATIKKYEQVVEDRNSRIAVLLSAKPFLIPGVTPLGKRNEDLEANEFQGRGGAGAASNQPEPASEHPTIQQPILRGRGGYQKRKKM